jgi:hypothetical protein
MARANYNPDALLLLTNIQYNLTNAEMEEVKDPIQRPSFGVPHNPFRQQQ